MCEVELVREDEGLAWCGGMENAYDQDEINGMW
jgi:hypothetical protein